MRLIDRIPEAEYGAINSDGKWLVVSTERDGTPRAELPDFIHGGTAVVQFPQCRHEGILPLEVVEVEYPKASVAALKSVPVNKEDPFASLAGAFGPVVTGTIRRRLCPVCARQRAAG